MSQHLRWYTLQTTQRSWCSIHWNAEKSVILMINSDVVMDYLAGNLRFRWSVVISNSWVGVGGPSPTFNVLLPSAFSPAAENCDEMPIPKPVDCVVIMLDCTYWLLLLLQLPPPLEWFSADKLCGKLYNGECNACSLMLFDELLVLLFAIWLLPSPIPEPPSPECCAKSFEWPIDLSTRWFFFDDVTGNDGDDVSDTELCWPLWLLLKLLLLLIVLLALCIRPVEGDDVGRFELCSELLSEFLFNLDAAKTEETQTKCY